MKLIYGPVVNMLLSLAAKPVLLVVLGTFCYYSRPVPWDHNE
jgi:hypothetical protein